MKKMSGPQKKVVITIACLAGAAVFMGAGYGLARASKPRIIANIQQEGQNQISSQNQGAGQQGGFVTLDTAKETALADAGLNSADVTFFKEREEIDDGIMIYDIEFFTGDTKYEYEINGITGAVMEKSSEMFQNNSLLGAMAQNPDGQNTGSQDTGSQGQNTGDQSTDSQNTGTQGTGNQSNGGQSTGSQNTGGQNSGGQSSGGQSSGGQSSGGQSSGGQSSGGQSSGGQSSGGQGSGGQSSGGQSSGGQSSGGQTQSGLIGIAAAKEIALSDAGVSAGSATFREEKQDWDDGIVVYDIEFYTSDMEYEYEIHGTTGAILDRSAESFYQGSGQPSGGGASTGNDIGVDQAKAIALSHAGLSMSDVTFSKAKLDWDDGYTVYEVEFYYGATEYDYTIDAYTGTILEYDYDWD